MDCDICAEKINQSNHRQIRCFRCGDADGTPNVCSSCTERYLTDTTLDPHCMHCRVAWDRPFLASVMTKSFLNGKWKKHRETLLFQRERSRFPTTIPILDRMQEIEKAQKQSLVYHQKMRHYSRLHQEQRDIIRTLERAMYNDRRRILNPRRENANREQGGGGDEEDEEEDATGSTNYARPCVKEACLGFIHSRTGDCRLCHRTTCVRCNVLLPDATPQIDRDGEVEETVPLPPHECQENDIAQWREIRRSTRPCPGCNARIFKISGCNQMFCTQCHTAFRWDNGQIERGIVHNPHAYTALQNPARVQARDLLGGLGGGQGGEGCRAEGGEEDATLPNRHVLRGVGGTRGIPVNDVNWARILNHYRNLAHIQEVDLPRYTRDSLETTHASKNLDIRIDFLSGKMSAEQYQLKLQKTEKAFQKNRELAQITQTLLRLHSTLYRRFITDATFRPADFILESIQIHDIVNSGIETLNKNFSSSISTFLPPSIN